MNTTPSLFLFVNDAWVSNALNASSPIQFFKNSKIPCYEKVNI